MLCQECNKRPATLHFTKIVNGEKTEFHICESCAREKGEMILEQQVGFPFTTCCPDCLILIQPAKVDRQEHHLQKLFNVKSVV